MRSIIYLCPATNSPIGGVKVIVRHAEMIDRLTPPGMTAQIAFPEDASFTIDWFEHAVSVRRHLNFNPTSDFVVVPEFWAPIFGRQLSDLGVPYGIFVQNGYQLTKNVPRERLDELKAIYGASSLILSISEDATASIDLAFPDIRDRIVALQYSIDTAIFSPRASKTRTITYMPRKLGELAQNVVNFLLLHDLRGWDIVPIDRMTEREVAETLSRSRIFMSFSDLEGVPVPPLEAALCGNLVVGYTGQGGREYWGHPSFREIACGDIRGFVRTVLDATRYLSAAGPDHDLWLDEGIADLKRRYGLAAEEQRLRGFITLVGAVLDRTGDRSASI